MNFWESKLEDCGFDRRSVTYILSSCKIGAQGQKLVHILMILWIMFLVFHSSKQILNIEIAKSSKPSIHAFETYFWMQFPLFILKWVFTHPEKRYFIISFIKKSNTRFSLLEFQKIKHWHKYLKIKFLIPKWKKKKNQNIAC